LVPFSRIPQQARRKTDSSIDTGSKIHGIAGLSRLKTGDTPDLEKLRVDVRIASTGVVADKTEAMIPAMGELTGN